MGAKADTVCELPQRGFKSPVGTPHIVNDSMAKILHEGTPEDQG